MKCVNCGNELIFRIKLQGISNFDGKARCLRCGKQWKVTFEELPEMTLQEKLDTHQFKELREAHERSLQIIGDKAQ